MSSKSLTAVTSFVSVIRERTVFVLRLNVRGCQRVAAPIAIIVCYLLALALFTAAGATDDMVKLTLRLDGEEEERGDLHFGLFRGTHSITPRISNTDEEPDTSQYLIHNVYEREDIVGVYATIVIVGITIILCIITALLAFFNIFGVYSSWIYGPPMIYILSLFSAFIGSLSIATISDYYLWELDDNSVSILRASLPDNLEYLADVYTSKLSLGYSFWLLCGGYVFLIPSFLLSWRLLALLDLTRQRSTPAIPPTSAFEMTQSHFDHTAPSQVYY